MTIATHARNHKRLRDIALGATAILVPLGVGLATSRRSDSRRWGLIAGGLAAATIGALRWQLQRWFTDEPAYTVERRIGELEIRRYAPRIEARTQIADASFDRALQQGFGRLARFIFGEKLAMTAPVVANRQADRHTVAFVMPPGRTVDSLPAPADARVEIVEVPAQRIAVLTFRGRYRAGRVAEEMQRVRALAAAEALSAAGEPSFAGFDPPSTLPVLRRNEIWLPIA